MTEGTPSRTLVRTLRPWQWTKNLLVFAAPAAAGVLHLPGTAARVGAAFLAFCLVASGTYQWNDVRDREEDRAHRRKQLRPVAAGTLAPRRAVRLGAALVLGGFVLAVVMTPPATVAVLALYTVATVSYTWRLKEVVGLEMVTVATGFVLRAIAGGTTAAVPLSTPFLVVVSGVALSIVATKRLTERLGRGPADRWVASPVGERTRYVLRTYPVPVLRAVRTGAGLVAFGAYLAWAIEGAAEPGAVWHLTSTLPFALALLRYTQVADRGAGEEPEEVLRRDLFVLVAGLTWGLLFLLGVYGVG